MEGIVVKLAHPGSDKVVELVATQHSKLDMGSIAATFGLNPVSLKLNGFYISRGPDFISSCLTWNDVLYYFATKGFPTGNSHQHPIIVDGSGLSHGSWVNFNYSENLNHTNFKEIGTSDKRKVWLEDSTISNLLKKRKNVEDNSVLSTNKIGPNSWANNKHSQDFGAKHTNCYTKRGRQEDFGEMHAEEKKMRFLYDCDVHSKSCVEQKKILWDGGNSLSVYSNVEMKKRLRNDDMLLACPCKKAR